MYDRVRGVRTARVNHSRGPELTPSCSLLSLRLNSLASLEFGAMT